MKHHEDSLEDGLLDSQEDGKNCCEDLSKEGGNKNALRDQFFKFYVVLTTIFVWAGYTLLVSYTRQMTPRVLLYSSSTVVFFSECTKLTITTYFVYFVNGKFSPKKGNQLIREEFLNKPIELAKMSVPSLAYALQNVLTQLKIPSTALFMVISVFFFNPFPLFSQIVFLRRRFSIRRWIAIFLLCVGVALVQLDISEDNNNKHGIRGNKLKGLLAVFSTALTAGFAGVYFEKMLKDGSTTPFWIRNMQMYSCGVVSALFGCYLKDFEQIREKGLTFGFTFLVWLIVLFLSLGGIYISLIMKYLDNLYKSFASSISIVVVVLLSLLIFENFQVTTFFFLGAFIVCFAGTLYNTVDY